MKWKTMILSGAFIGVFTLGAMFSPVSKSIATNNNKAVPVEDTALFKQTSSYNCPITNAPMGRRNGTSEYFSSSMFELIAEKLGMTDEEFRTEHYAGKSIAEIAEEQGKTVDELVNQVLEARKKALDQFIENDVITEEQREIMLANFETRVRTMVEKDNFEPMQKRGGMGMGHHRAI
ncbi:DUF2680 domain-containing protein [Bacillus tuaregi]|uniref:DUF2680 domain-containing protein n=1 Tax=Bacillus tuaregi TaxID=1816695 RepID=UPI0008F83EDA|nr:DUF2680 domain-containing protein [Bacillus tuaregi]